MRRKESKIMCKDCGCETANHHHNHSTAPGWHVHADGTAHTHHDDHAHAAATQQHTRIVSVEEKILAHNDALAAANRAWLQERGVVAINLISSPGSGKTFLLEKTLELLNGRVPCAVIAGDQQTDRDAQRLAGKGAPVRQIETGSSCHLNAEQISHVLPDIVTPGIRLLFIENVGNLVCPAAFDLGEHCKVALLSVTEGEDKPLKYPSLFTTASVVALTKTDLLPHLPFDLKQCRANVRRMRPGVFVFELSALTGVGMEAWINYLISLTA